MDTLTVQVWRLDFAEFKSPAAKLVALALARRSRESGSCWAKQATIAQDCGVSKQTVHRCLEELEGAGWLKRVSRRRGDGSRSSDMLWLTLPETTLNATTVDPNEAKRLLSDDAEIITTVETQGDSVGVCPPPGSQGGPISESQQKDSLKDSKERSSVREAADVAQVDYTAAVDAIWAKASKIGRQRSSKADIEKALRAAVARGHSIERIMRGLGAYFASHDATKDDGAYQRGAHVVLANDRWQSFLDDAEARAAAGETVTPETAAATADMGTAEAPTEKRQRLWMTLWKEGMAWDPERGPQPGRLGCRVSDAVLREFGVEPFQAPAATDDAAFD